MYVYINPCLADADCAKPSVSVTTLLLNLCTLSSGLNFVQPRTKTTKLEEKKSLGYKHISLSTYQTADSATATAHYCWEDTTYALRSLRWLLTQPRMGLVLNLGAAGAVCLPSHRLFKTRMLLGNGGTTHTQKWNSRKLEEMLSQRTTTVTELSAGKD